jgi:hypothetical protein
MLGLQVVHDPSQLAQLLLVLAALDLVLVVRLLAD